MQITMIQQARQYSSTKNATTAEQADIISVRQSSTNKFKIAKDYSYFSKDIYQACEFGHVNIPEKSDS